MAQLLAGRPDSTEKLGPVFEVDESLKNNGTLEQNCSASLVSTGLPMAGIFADSMFEVAPKRERYNQPLFSLSKMRQTLPVNLLSWKLIAFWGNSGSEWIGITPSPVLG